MRWPADHPVRTDDALARHCGGAEELCPDAVVVEVLRHLPGRRVATLVSLADGRLGVLMVFASPRARGNDRRLRILAATGARELVPRPLGADRNGHVSLVEHVPGAVFDALDDVRFVQAAPIVGAALRALHESGASLDRAWTLDDELAALVRGAPEATREQVRRAQDAPGVVPGGVLVPAHRDCHPRQIVLDERGRACWIDLDDAAMAPAGLDAGNMVGHLRRDALVELRPRDVVDAAIDGFLAGYGEPRADDVDAWAALTQLRLAGLATSRHGRPEWTARLLSAGAR